ncbi:ribosome maturation factor RimP [Xanthomonadaceae bacterium JHOS43]|jgi:ribosome maturation factor RimP|nr:ribosome maturation factor RimP [Xanthomonadaceae bacterium JHOS43]MCX7564354.1 ribosome maturation factor RimP [Xanthomonadaceae bacterium XH05]
MSQIGNDIEALLAPVIESLGLELLGLEFRPGVGNALLRLYIDAPEREGGVTLDDCEAVSRQVSAIMDVNDPIDSHYTLEVSSPGVDRPLFKPAHFARFIGESAKIALEFPQDGRRRFQGRILAVDGDVVTIEQDGQPVALSCSAMQKAKLVPVFEMPAKPGRDAAGSGRKKRGA